MRCVMASQAITYKAGDAVAFMPLLVGLKLDGNNDLGLTEPLFRYKPPNADIFQQSWKVQQSNAITLAWARKAMKIAGASAVHAQTKENTHEYKGIDGIRVKDSISNSYVAVLGKIQEIENRIKAKLEDSKVRTAILKNAQDMREDTATVVGLQIRKQLELGTAHAEALVHLLENGKAVERRLSNVFSVSVSDSGGFSGARSFESFWAGTIEPNVLPPAFGTEVQNQEQIELDKFRSILTMYSKLYAGVLPKLSSKTFQTSIRTAFIAAKSVPDDAHRDRIMKRVEEKIDEYLWNVLIERFEILDSIVSTFFSYIGSTRNSHSTIVQKFMPNAILFCISPLFKYFIPSEKAPRAICSFFNDHSAAFRATLKTMFDTGLTVEALSTDCRHDMRSQLDAKLLVGKKFITDGHYNDDKNNNFKQLSVFIGGCLTGQGNKINELRDLCTEKGVSDLKLQNEISVNRATGDDLIVLNAIRALTKDSDIVAEQVAKRIVYSSLLRNSNAYFKFHYKVYNYDSRPEISYFKAAKSPLGLFETVQAEPKAGNAAEPKAGNAAEPKPGNAGEIESNKSDLKFDPLTITDILDTDKAIPVAIESAMNLRPGFSPLPPKKTTPPPQTPRASKIRPASAVDKSRKTGDTKTRPATANNTKGRSGDKPKGKKKKSTPP